MKPGKLDLPTIWRGCDWGPVTLKWKNQNGDPIDVTYWQAVAQSLNVNLNPSVLDGEEGITQIALTKAQTAVLKLGTESWDWIWQRPGGQYRFPPFLSGKVDIKQPVSGLEGSLPPPIVIPPDVPVAISASAILSNRFHANWDGAARATGYRLDVSRNTDFTSFVPGFQNRDVHNVTTFLVDGLSPSTTYHYRLRAYNAGGTTHNSNVIHVTTLAPPAPANDALANNIVMPGSNGHLTGTTVGATRETGEPAGENSVWYHWSPNSIVNASISVNGAVNRIGVYRYDPSQPSGWPQLVHVINSVIGFNGNMVATFVTARNTLYLVRVYKNTGTAAFTLDWISVL